LPFEYSDVQKEFYLFILTAVRDGGVHVYRELLQTLDRIGRSYTLLTAEGRATQRIEILFAIFQFRRVQLPDKIAIHLVPQGAKQFSSGGTPFQNSRNYQSLGGAIRQVAEVGLDRLAEQLKVTPQAIDRSPRANRPQATRVQVVAQAVAQAQAVEEPQVIEVAVPSRSAARTSNRSGLNRGDDAAPDRKRA
jgi:hypothetical protein